MSPSTKDKLVGGLVTLVVTVVAALLLAWLTRSSPPSGTILYIDSDITERTIGFDPKQLKNVVQSESYIKKIDFFNLKNDLADFSIIIPVQLPDSQNISIETKVDSASIKEVSGKDDVARLGGVRVEVEKMKKGGQLTVEISSADKLNISYVRPHSPSDGIKILSPSSLFLYLD